MTALLKSVFVWLVLLIFSLSIQSSAWVYGSKVVSGDPDESLPLSPFSTGPRFAFIDLNNNGIFEPGDPVYISINHKYGVVSENDVRVTPFSTTLMAGTQVLAQDADFGKTILQFGTNQYPAAEVRYFDMDGDNSYSKIDPVYLDMDPGSIDAGDIRITGYPLEGNIIYAPGTRVRDSDQDSDKPTTTLPAMFSFYNANGNINNAGWAIYDTGDTIYLDTQNPFNAVTANDVRGSV